MAKTLIVFYSLTGFTRKAAEELASRNSWDLAEIKDRRAREGFWGYSRSLLESSLGIYSDFDYGGPDPGSYDLVLLGSPVWGWHIASPLRSFYARYRDRLKRVAFFFTFGGGGADKVTRQVRILTGDTTLQPLFLTDSEMQSESFRDRLDPFIRQLSGARALGLGDSVPVVSRIHESAP